MVQKYRSLTTGGAMFAGAVLATCGILTGCPASAPRPDASQSPQEVMTPPASPNLPPPPAPNVPSQHVAPPPRENHLSPATRSLVTQAQTLKSKGDLDGASATLDRALRIEPNNPLLWIERGRLRLAESDAKQAEACGRRALALASGDPVTRKQAGRLLADALRAQRRNPEAHEVETQPFMR